MPPPIRYPLPTLIAIVLVSLLVWKGEAWTRPTRAALAERLKRAVEGPPVPNSARPQVVAGRATRRALLLHDATPAAARPGGRTTTTIEPKAIVGVFDIWPATGPTTHLRVGQRTAVGWIGAGDALAWSNRLVLRLPSERVDLAPTADSATASPPFAVGDQPAPVVGWTDRAVEVVVWDRAEPWTRVARRGWVSRTAIPAEAWAVWISDVELPIALRLAIGDDPGAARILAALGHLVDGQAWSPADRLASAAALPPGLPPAPSDPRQARARLAEANANPRVDAAWGGFSFRALPLDHLP